MIAAVGRSFWRRRRQQMEQSEECVAWSKNMCFSDTLDVFRRMQMVGMQPDWTSLVAVLLACAQLGALELGKWIHFYAEKNSFLGPAWA
ncbi:hypothetical protein ACS0TY_010106 [Phlomoides rotata]